MHRVAGDQLALEQVAGGIHQRDIGTGDGGGAGAAIGLQHIAIERDRAFAERGAIHAGTQAAPDQALNLQRASALLAAGRLALAAAMGGARQHAVFGSHPALALATQKTRYTIFHAGGAQHAGRSEEHTSELKSLMRISYAVFCLNKNNTTTTQTPISNA